MARGMAGVNAFNRRNAAFNARAGIPARRTLGGRARAGTATSLGARAGGGGH
jgi:hypothetical protein